MIFLKLFNECSINWLTSPKLFINIENYNKGKLEWNLEQRLKLCLDNNWRMDITILKNYLPCTQEPSSKTQSNFSRSIHYVF